MQTCERQRPREPPRACVVLTAPCGKTCQHYTGYVRVCVRVCAWGRTLRSVVSDHALCMCVRGGPELRCLGPRPHHELRHHLGRRDVGQVPVLVVVLAQELGERHLAPLAALSRRRRRRRARPLHRRVDQQLSVPERSTGSDKPEVVYRK